MANGVRKPVNRAIIDRIGTAINVISPIPMILKIVPIFNSVLFNLSLVFGIRKNITIMVRKDAITSTIQLVILSFSVFCVSIFVSFIFLI